MNIQKHFASCLLFVLICASSERTHAVNYPSGAGYSPFDDASCLISGMARGCFAGDLLGPVSRILYPDAKRTDYITVFDRSGRVVESHGRFKDLFGGWSRSKVTYGADGTKESVSLDGKLIREYRYSNRLISKEVSFDDSGLAPSCAYAVLDSSPEQTSLSQICGRFQSIATFNGKRQLLKLYGDGVARKYIRTGYPGPIECAYEMTDKSLISVCTDGHYEHRIERDQAGRKLAYQRIAKQGNDRLAVRFSYANDNVGNWISQTMKYEELSVSRSGLPKDVIESRTIEYFR